MEEKKIKVYFPGLNSLRFLAAFLVFACHVELLKGRNGYSNLYNTLTFQELGGAAVTFFFVLSGFLITYLLFVEKSNSGNISVGKFYMRRILRIWPLYYFVVLCGFFLIPHIPVLQNSISAGLYENFNRKLILFLLFLPNLSYVLFAHTPYISPAWSIGVEEQFYLAWPLLMKKTRSPMALFIKLIGGIYFIKTALTLTVKFSSNHPLKTFCTTVLEVMYFARFECMVAGGIFAYMLFFKNEKVLTFLYNKYLQIISYLLIISFMSTGFKIPVVNHLVYSFLFGVVILNIAANPESIFRLENKVLNYLGQISFGLYMYHEIAIGFTIKALQYAGLNFNNIFHGTALYIAALAATISIASLSYRFFEQPFLKIKTRFSKITDK